MAGSCEIRRETPSGVTAGGSAPRIQIPRNCPAKSFTIIAALVAWTGPLLQLYISVHRSLTTGTSLLAGLNEYVSYFTILTNLLVALALTAHLLRDRCVPALLFERPGFSTGIAASIAVTCIAYNVLLRGLWEPKGLSVISDMLLHHVTPVLFLIFWWVTVPAGNETRWDHAVRWCLYYPTAYFIYVMTRGAVSGVYPYPFVDVNVIGFNRAFLNGIEILIGFAVVALILVAAARFKGAASFAPAPQRTSR